MTFPFKNNSNRLVIELVLGTALAAGAVMVAMPVLAPGLGMWGHDLVAVMLLLLLTGPLVCWRTRRALSRPPDAGQAGRHPTRLPAQAAWRETDQLLATLSRHAIVTMTDRSGVIIEVNDAFCAISGYAREELLGQPHRIVNSGTHDKAFWSEFWQTLGRGETWRGETCNRARDGTLFWTDSIVSPLRGADGRIERYLSIRFDITPRKQAELELNKALASAERASCAKSDFLANMSHEIRTPMNAVIGLTRLLLDTELSLYQRDYLQRIELSATALLGVLNDVLDYSRIEAGHLHLEAVPLCLAEVLEKTRLMFASQAETKGLRLDFSLAADVPAVLQGDPLRLLQVIHNLVGNALKFTHQGSVRVSVACAERTEASVLLEVKVTDSGIGLTREQLDRLFTAFEQADSSTTRQYGGSGLGLSICKRLVEMMGGRIGVDTAFGVGSSFWFTVRLERSHEAPVALLDQSQPSASLRGARVLVVDDNPTNLLVAQNYLERLGLEVHNAVSGPQAIAKVGQTAFDAILMDLQMPEMDGFEATRAIRAMGQQLPIIALSASAMVNDQQAAQAAGMNAHVSKPIDPARLATVLTRWIPARATAAAPAPRPARDSEASGLARPRLLIVDDTRVNLIVLQGMLEDSYALSLASSGQQALDLLAHEPAPDLILLDVMMPGMDGYQVQAALKQQPATRDIPVIFITASGDGASEARLLQAGAVDFLHKPIQREVLRTRVRLQLDLAHQRLQLEALNQRLGLSLEEVRQAKQVMAQAHARELEISGIIQQQLLFGAPPAELDELQVACHSEASRGMDGDFYAFTRIGPDSFEVLTGDVMGKGMAAALIGAGVKNLYRKYFTELQTWGEQARPPSPAALVNAIHRDIAERLVALETFVTLTLLRFDRQTFSVTWVNAGHSPTLLARSGSGQVDELLGDNVPIGVLEHEVYQQHVTPFRPGDVLMLYSDGVSEAQDPHHHEYGKDRIVQLMHSQCRQGASPARLLQALLDDLRRFTHDAPASDDRTVIVVQAQAPGSRLA